METRHICPIFVSLPYLWCGLRGWEVDFMLILIVLICGFYHICCQFSFIVFIWQINLTYLTWYKTYQKPLHQVSHYTR